MEVILALDQGTTSSRAVLFDREGKIVGVAQRELPQIFPNAGWVEHDPELLWSTQIEAAAEVIERAPQASIKAIGITNQRETTLIWDRITGKAVANAIVWQDRRTAAFCDQLRNHETEIQRRTGLVLDPYFSATKIRWLLDHVPGVRDAATKGDLAFGTVDSWLIWRLTSGRSHVTDVTNASRTLLFDIERGEWNLQLCELFGIPAALLPEVRRSSEVIWRTADGLPIPSGIPIAGIAGDQQASLFGQRCVRPGMAKNTYGTGSFLVMNSGGDVVRSTHGLLSTIACSFPERPLQYALEGSIFISGAAVQWLRDGLGIIRSAADIEPLAGSVHDTDGVVFVPAFTGLGTPHWDPQARGAILGLTRRTTNAHLARATLEAIALQTAEVLDAMAKDSGSSMHELRVDGGASTNDLLMQIQADIAGIPVIRTAISETTSLGAAYLAGLAIGFWPSEDGIDNQWKASHTFMPSMKDPQRRELRERWSEAVRRAGNWAR